jgi:hypothetical protein
MVTAPAYTRRKPAVINLTPHPAILRDEHGAVLEAIPPSGKTARTAETAEPIGVLEIGAADVPWERKTYGAPDLLVPGQQTRDENGTVNGCRTLASLA